MMETFDPSDARDRRRWRYDSEHPLSIAQLIARKTVDAATAALVWLLLECGASLSVAGWELGLGKTTTLGALLQLLPEETNIHLTAGMLEDFSFTRQAGMRPGATCVVCNEVNDWPPYYMWGEQARRYLSLPAQGWRVATTLHARTLAEVLGLYHEELGLGATDLGRLGIVVTLGLVGGRGRKAEQRRWLTTHFLRPREDGAPARHGAALELSRWRSAGDAFEGIQATTLAELASWAGCPLDTFEAALARRRACLCQWAQGEGADPGAVATALRALRSQEPGLRPIRTPAGPLEERKTP